MAEKNAWGRMRESIIGRFADQDHLTQQRAWFLYIFCFSLVIMFVVLGLLLLSVDVEKFNKAVAPIILIIICAVVCIFLIRGKKYKIAANTLLVIMLLLVAAGFFIKYNGPIIYEGYMSYIHFMYIGIAFATLFCERKAILITTGWFLFIFFTYFFAIKDKIGPEAQSIVSSSFADGLISIVLTSILSLLIITAMRRANSQLMDSVSDVRESSQKLTEIAGTIDASSQNLAHGSISQAAAMEETSAMLKEISEKTRKNSETVQDAQRLMQDTAKIIKATNSSLKGLRAAMNDVNEASVQTVRIVQTIDSIAFQTNLLALNAAVEAARAGETGAGFAVVADEVRNLAKKSAEASKNTQDIIGNNIENIKKSTGLAVSSHEAFSTFLKLADQLSDHLKMITESSEDQSQGIKEIEKSVDDINTIIQSNAASAEETAAVSTELSSMADNIENFVHKLEQLVKA